jgi:hypothetical protein
MPPRVHPYFTITEGSLYLIVPVNRDGRERFNQAKNRVEQFSIDPAPPPTDTLRFDISFKTAARMIRQLAEFIYASKEKAEG